MRLLFIEEGTSLSALAKTLSRNAGAADTLLQRILVLNPQLADTRKVPAGSAVLLPDAPELKPNAGSPVGDQNLSELSESVDAGLRAVEKRVSAHLNALAEHRAVVNKTLKSAAAKRLVESDPQLRNQLAAAEAGFRNEQQRTAESQAQLKEVQKSAIEAFSGLQKLFR